MTKPKKEEKKLREEAYSEVYRTTDYELFDLFAENRIVDQRSVLPLQREIEKKDLLHLFPIIIDGDGRILDGQRRLAAARNLSKPIYYVITTNGEMGIGDVASVNHAAKRWMRDDYLHYWCERKVHDYVVLRDFWHKYQNWMTLSVATAICVGESASSTLSENQREAFNNGRYQITDMRFALQFVGAMKSFLGVFKRATDRPFMAAVCYLIRHPEYNHGRMEKKLDSYPGILQPQRDRDGYLANLEELYNHYSHTSRVRFR